MSHDDKMRLSNEVEAPDLINEFEHLDTNAMAYSFGVKLLLVIVAILGIKYYV